MAPITPNPAPGQPGVHKFRVTGLREISKTRDNPVGATGTETLMAPGVVSLGVVAQPCSPPKAPPVTGAAD